MIFGPSRYTKGCFLIRSNNCSFSWSLFLFFISSQASFSGYGYGSPVFLFTTPYSPFYLILYLSLVVTNYFLGLTIERNDAKRNFVFILSIGVKTEHRFEFWDYSNASMILKSKYFNDQEHLNDLGAHEFTRLITDRLLD